MWSCAKEAPAGSGTRYGLRDCLTGSFVVAFLKAVTALRCDEEAILSLVDTTYCFVATADAPLRGNLKGI